MRPIHVLLVEDNEGDILLTREALEDSGAQITLSVVKDGSQAIDFVSGHGVYQDSVLPDLLLLDVNLPKNNGHEVLKFIKENDSIKHLPVIMFTTSSSERDILSCYQNHANSYITKPAGSENFLEAVAKIENYWISVASLPNAS